MAGDAYTDEYMAAREAVFTEKMVSKRMARLGIGGGVLAALFTIAGGAAAASGGHDLAMGLLGGATGGLLVGGYVGMMSLMFLAQRVTVTRTELKVQLGLWGPTIPLATIRRVELVPVPRVRGRDVGIISPESTHCLRIEHEAKGKTKVFLLGTEEPDALMRALDSARAEPAARVRVGAGSTDATVEEAESDATKGRSASGRADA